MKKLLIAVAAFFFAVTVNAQETKKANWKEMHDFHGVMSKTFHPAEENNLQPVKDHAGDLVMKAKAWQLSKAPEGYNGKITAPILKTLVAQCEAIQAAVKAKKADKDLKEMITKAHDTFHEIMEKCRDGEKH